MLFLYKITTIILYPFLIILVFMRKIVGKEDPSRFKEKIFFQKSKSISGKLIWFHVASIGELNSVVPIVKSFLNNNKGLNILITSVTLSSGKIFENEFKNQENIIHKYFPIDVPHLIKNFIEKWNPSLVIFVDSEIWPNCIFQIKKKNIPTVLLNARITDKTCKRWLFLKNFANKIFSSFDICIASSINSRDNLKLLGANNIEYYGNLKYIETNKRNKKLEKSVTDSLKDRKVWLAASTHDGEEKFCLAVHRIIKKKYPDILTIIAPRHINRIEDIVAETNKSELKVQIIKSDEAIKNETDVVLINSFGSLNKYYSYCKNIFIGKSLNKDLILEGGQNPIEAARFGCKIYHGPYIYNFLEVYQFLKINEISEEINNTETLSSKIIYNLSNQSKIDESKIKKIDEFGKNIFDKTIKKLEKMI